MKDLPAHQLDPKVKTVWRINDAIWLTVVFLCCFVPFAIAAMVDPATWMFVVLVAVAVAYAACLIVWLIVLPPIRFMRWRYELSSDYLDIAKGIVWRKRFVIPFIRVQNTDTRQGPILRAFGLSSVTVATAAGEHEIPGLALDVAEQLRRSSASDFGLRGELPYIDAVIAAVNDESNLLEKEHKIDRIRWQQAVDLAAEDYFNVNAVLSYLVRINLVARWTQLDEARGRAMLGRLLRELDGKELINNK